MLDLDALFSSYGLKLYVEFCKDERARSLDCLNDPVRFFEVYGRELARLCACLRAAISVALPCGVISADVTPSLGLLIGGVSLRSASFLTYDLTSLSKSSVNFPFLRLVFSLF